MPADPLKWCRDGAAGHPGENQMIRTMKPVLLAALASALIPVYAQQGPTDPQIAAIVVTANQVDIDAGKLAKSKSKNKEVDKFAQQMITDHTGVNKQAVALVTKLKVKPEPSDTSKSLKKGGDENMAKLKKLKGAEFDKAYVDHEVDYHQAVLDAIDKTLIPSAKNAELKGLIEKVRPAIAAHLDHAKHLQASLGK
jgi:putative membrane protein